MFPFTVYLLHNTILNNVNIASGFYLFLIFQPAKKKYYPFYHINRKKIQSFQALYLFEFILQNAIIYQGYF